MRQKWPFSAEGAGLGKKSESAKAVSKIDHPRQAPKCYQTTEPDPGNTCFCKILQTPKFRAVEETGEAEVPLPVKGLQKRNSPVCGRRFTFFTKVAEIHSKSLINP